MKTVGDAGAGASVSVADGVPDVSEVLSMGKLVTTEADAEDAGTVVVPTVRVKLAVDIERVELAGAARVSMTVNASRSTRSCDGWSTTSDRAWLSQSDSSSVRRTHGTNRHGEELRGDDASRNWCDLGHFSVIVSRDGHIQAFISRGGRQAFLSTALGIGDLPDEGPAEVTSGADTDIA